MTNGITPRRWLLACNPGLSELISEKVGDDWPKDLDKLQKIADFADNAAFQKKFMAMKRANKVAFAEFVKETAGSRLAQMRSSMCRSSVYMNTSASTLTCCIS